MTDFNPDDVLTISTTSDVRKFTVVSMNTGPAVRAVLRGVRGAHRILCKIGPHVWHIHEDDGEKNRGRPCTVDQVEREPVKGPMASVDPDEPTIQPPDHPPTWLRARYELGRALGLPAETTWAICIHEAELMRKAADLDRYRPIMAKELAKLVNCETAREIAEWVIERDATHACVANDRHAADNGAAMKLYLASLEVRRLSAEAADD